MWLYILLLAFGSIAKSNEIKTFNDFDTFILSPKNTKDKACPLKVECSYEKSKLTSVVFKTVGDSVILSESVKHIDGVNYYIWHGKRIWDNENLGKTYKIVRVKYVSGDVVRNIALIVMDNTYRVTEVSELSKDNTYRGVEHNWKELGKYSSVEDFIKNGLKKLKTKRSSSYECVFMFRYDKKCEVGCGGITLTGQEKDKLPKKGDVNFDYTSSYGQCLYLDYFKYQSYRDR